MTTKSMTRIFISQPMRGKTDDEIKQERQRIVDACVNEYGEDIEIIDSFFEGCPYGAQPAWFLGKSIELLSSANAVYFADGWENARGCRIEHQVAANYGIRIIHDGYDVVPNRG